MSRLSMVRWAGGISLYEFGSPDVGLAAAGCTFATSPEVGDGKGQKPPCLRVRCTKEKPSDNRTAVEYRNDWF